MDNIIVSHFSKKFGGKVVHQDVNINVAQGECLGLIGGSGAGKSVILRSLIGLEKPDGGTIKVMGEEIQDMNEKQLVEVRKNVAYVFQNGALFDSMDVFDNLAYPLREHTSLTLSEIEDKVLNSLEIFGMAGTEKLFPSELSGGMQKRVGLARSTILDPSVVLYDEPTAGLDPFNTLKIQEMILKFKSKSVTSVFVTHDMPSAFAVCDRIALLQEGRITEVIKTSEIKNHQDSQITDFISGKIY